MEAARNHAHTKKESYYMETSRDKNRGKHQQRFANPKSF